MLCRHDSDVSASHVQFATSEMIAVVGLSLATILLGYEALVAWRLASDYACARHLNAPGAVRLNTPGKRLAPCARTAPWLCAPTEWVRPGSYPSAQRHLITSDLCRRNHLITSDLCRRNHLITSDLCRRRRAFKSGTASVHAANCSTGKTRSFKSVTARACAVRGRRSSKAASPKAGSPPGVAAAPPTAGTGPNVASNCRPRVSCTAPCRHPGRHRGWHSERPSVVIREALRGNYREAPRRALREALRGSYREALRGDTEVIREALRGN